MFGGLKILRTFATLSERKRETKIVIRGVVLNNSNSYVIYDVDICNLGNVIMGISSASIDNENLKFEFLDYNLKDKICENNQCSLGVKKA